MRTVRSQELARRVIDFYNKNNCAVAQTVKFFAQQAEPRRTIYAIIERYEKEGRIDYSKRRGGLTKCTPELIENVKQKCIAEPEISYTDLAEHFGCTRGTARNACKRAEIRSLVQQSAPSYSSRQIERCKTAAANILKRTAPKHGSKVIIMDDETYVYHDPRENPGRKFYKKFAVKLCPTLSGSRVRTNMHPNF
jgi:hypothetical protein